MIGIVTVKVQGHRKMYNSSWVNKMANMVDRNLNIPHKHICLTDNPNGLDDRIVPILLEKNKIWEKKGWWTKLKCFDPEIQDNLCDRNLFLDLDSLVVNDLFPIINLPGDFLLAESTAPNFNPKGTINKYSSSIMVWNRGVNTHIWTDFTFDVTKRLRGDQDWMGEIIEVDTIPKKYYQRLGGCIKKGKRKDTIIIFCVKPKNDIAAKEIDWVREVWK